MSCGKHHPKGKRPPLCDAEREVFQAYCKEAEVWQVMHAVHIGAVKLRAEALLLLHKRGQVVITKRKRKAKGGK